MAYGWLPLGTVNLAARAAARRGVSERARSPGQFLTQYRRAGGDPSRLAGDWEQTRNNFVGRHMAQVRANAEPLWKRDAPTPRHLALAVWAYSPTPRRLHKWLMSQKRRNPGLLGKLSDYISGERGNPPEHRKRGLTGNAAKRYVASHWGRPSGKVYDQWDDQDDIDGPLTVMGALREIRVKGLGTLQFDGTADVLPDGTLEYKGSILAFSPRKDERLFNMLSPRDARAARRLIDDRREWEDLDDISVAVGGRQADYTYPRNPVQVLGPATHIVYYTLKGEEDDPQGGLADFIHEMGEDGGKKPLLCVGSDGRLWFAGGDFHVPHDGITN